MKNVFKIKEEGNWGALIISILIAEGVGFLSYLFSGGDTRAWFEVLNKPSFAPPAWVFPVVWSILYFLMGAAAYRIWILGKKGLNVNKALTLYAVQLMLNFAWSIIFFRFKLLWIAFLEIILLFTFIILTMLEFRRFDRISFYLMIPYAIWTAFAAILAYAVWIMN